MVHIKKQKHGINKQNDSQMTDSLPELYSNIIQSLFSFLVGYSYFPSTGDFPFLLESF